MPISVCMLVSNLDSPAGMEQQAAQLGQALNQSGANVWFLTRNISNRTKSGHSFVTDKIIRIPSFLTQPTHLGALGYAVSVLMILFWQKNKYQILHSHHLATNGVLAGLIG